MAPKAKPAATAKPAPAPAKPTKVKLPPEEIKRVKELFKEFCDVGASKVDVSQIAALVKEVLKGAKAAPETIKRLVGAAKEALPAKCPSGVLAPNDFQAWYFEHAWPELQEKKAEKAAAPAKKRPGPGGAADAAAAATAAAAGGAGGGAGGAGKTGADAAASATAGSAAANAADGGGGAAGAMPVGWALGRSLHPEECRRLLQVSAAFMLPTGARGRIPQRQVLPLLRQALLPVDEKAAAEWAASPALAATAAADAPPGEEPTVAVGLLVKFWFDVVWPKCSKPLLAAHHAKKA